MKGSAVHAKLAGTLMVVLCAAAALAQSPEVAAKLAQASNAMRAGQLDEAGDRFAEVTKLAPSFAEAHFNLGLVREEQGRYPDAVISLKRALQLKPGLHGANLFLGIAYFRLNQLDEAAAALQKETAAYSKDANAWMWLGVIRLAQERAEDAADALDRAARLKPDDADILYHRGRAHLLVSNQSYSRMFKADPNSWRVHRVIAQANAEAERHVDAIHEYEAAIALAPNQPGLHEELGSEYRNAGKIPEAEAAFQRELELDPHNVLARYKLGVLAVEKGDGATAKELIEAALKEKPGLVNVDYNLGRAEMLLGHDEAAAVLLDRATRAQSEPEVIQQAWYQLGIVSRRLHRPDAARNAMAMFQKLKDQEAEKSQKQLKRYEASQSPNAGDAPVPDAAPADKPQM